MTGIENGKQESTIEVKADGAHENGIASVHQEESAACELSNETKEDCVAKQEDGNISHEGVNGDLANGYPCELKKENSTAVIQPGQPVFLVKSWRSQLCRCPACLRMYEERGLGFLLDSDDTLQVLLLYGSLSLIHFYLYFDVISYNR